MKILFLHGTGSKPGDVRASYLVDHGHEVLNPALPDDDFDEAVRIAQAEYDQGRPDVVVGFGGYPTIPALGAAVLLEGPNRTVDHLTLEVTLEQPYLVDVGFGDGFIRPLPLNSTDVPHSLIVSDNRTEALRRLAASKCLGWSRYK